VAQLVCTTFENITVIISKNLKLESETLLHVSMVEKLLKKLTNLSDKLAHIFK
jgi:hypothetical protein